MNEDPIARAAAHWDSRGWGSATAGMRLVTSITRVQQLFHQRIDALLQPDLTFARYEILMILVLSRRGALPMSVIGNRLQVHPASVTSAVERLERDGLVVRERAADDRRRVLAHITAAGRRRALVATDLLNRAVFEQTGLAGDDLDKTQSGLDVLRAHLGDLPAPAAEGGRL